MQSVTDTVFENFIVNRDGLKLQLRYRAHAEKEPRWITGWNFSYKSRDTYVYLYVGLQTCTQDKINDQI